MKNNFKSAFLPIDIEEDFLPTGSMKVPNGDKVIPIVNKVLNQKGKLFDLAVATKDWHPEDHCSFIVNGGIWAIHCVRNTKGAEFPKVLLSEKFDKIIEKGTDSKVDSYSGFFDNDHISQTGLDKYLKENNVKRLFVAGLATDYCVKFTVLDALTLGYEVIVIIDACAAVNVHPEDEANAISEMIAHGAVIVTSDEIL
ncbi:MAG: bifunctional nicotinamidase/pyrazinamidase [Candidatus Nomurabacteria bacterium]